MLITTRCAAAMAIAGLVAVCPAVGQAQRIPVNRFLQGVHTVAIDVTGQVDSLLQAQLLQVAVLRLERAGLRVTRASPEQTSTPVLVLTIDVIPGLPMTVKGRLQFMVPSSPTSPVTVDRLSVWDSAESINGELLEDAKPLVNRLIVAFISVWEHANR